MTGGTRTTLSDVCESVRYGYTASATTEPRGPRFLRITDIASGSLDWDAVPYCQIAERDMERFRLLVGDIVVARTGATVGCGRLIRESVTAVCASYLVRFRVDPNKAEPGFVGRVVESQLYRKFVLSQIGGSAQPNASAPVLGSFEFNLPNRHEQMRIAEILATYDGLIENNRRRIALLEAAARLLYREWFVHFRFPGHEQVKFIDGLPEGWQRRYLGDVVTTQYGHTASASDQEVGPKFVRGTDINKRSFVDWSTVPYCPEQGLDFNKYALLPGDILVIRMADPGKVAIIEKPIHSVFASYLVRLKIRDPGEIPPIYMFMTLMDERYQGFIHSSSGGATRKSASAKLLTDFHFAQPPKVLLRRFVEQVTPMRKMITKLVDQSSAAAQARDLLLPRLMNGEIEV